MKKFNTSYGTAGGGYYGTRPYKKKSAEEKSYNLALKDEMAAKAKAKALMKMGSEKKKGAYDITRGYDKSYRKENPSAEKGFK